MLLQVEAAHHDNGTVPSIGDHTYANQNKINPLVHMCRYVHTSGLKLGQYH